MYRTTPPPLPTSNRGARWSALIIVLLCAGAGLGIVANLSGRRSLFPEIEVKRVNEFYVERNILIAAAAKLSPDEAAKRWLVLADRFAGIRGEEWWRSDSDYSDRGIDALLNALPGPEAWDKISAGIRARPTSAAPTEAALRVLAAALDGTPAARTAIHTEIKALIESRNAVRTGDVDDAMHADEALANLSAPGSPEALAATRAAWTSKLASVLKAGPSGLGGYLNEIPDLVALFGEERAMEDLKKLCVGGVTFFRIDGRRTSELFSRTAKATIGEWKSPIWYAITEDADPALFDAIEKRFGSDTANAVGSRGGAVETQLAILLGRNEIARAADLGIAEYRRTGEVPTPGHRRSRAKIPADQSAGFYDEIFRRDPAAAMKSAYTATMAKAGRSEEAVTRLRAFAARTDLTPAARAVADEYLTQAMLADGNTDEATPRLLAILKNSSGARRLEAARTLMYLAPILKRPELFDKAITFYKKGADRNSGGYEKIQTINYFIAAKHSAEAEMLAREFLSGRGDSRYYSQEALTSLVVALRLEGRYAEALDVLTKDSRWEAADLRDITGTDSGKSLFSAVAECLEATGKTADAKRVADFAVSGAPGDDSAYALLLGLTGANDAFLARMDAQFATDRFEERPLIWKATALHKLGRNAEALAFAKAAVAIDPSDGEEGKGDRMRAYAVLADILETEGDAETAKIYRGAVTAIRMSEDADDLATAGLLKPALARWEEALTKFADAYCVQSRLAIRYAQTGDMEKAEAHYTRAFELMPDSFGRIESHCFGCEHAFESETAQGIAEKVFIRVIASRPGNPQAHYLLGYLRESQGRDMEAAASYRQAASLDPDYFNAWKKLYELRNRAAISQGERSACAATLLRLDPHGRHIATGELMSDIGDLRQAWKTNFGSDVRSDAAKTPLFALTAASAELGKNNEPTSRNPNRPLTPARFLEEVPLIKAAKTLAAMDPL